jgi:hypothetical protein
MQSRHRLRLLASGLVLAGAFGAPAEEPTFSPGSLTFADQTVGTVSPPQPVTLTNDGSTAVELFIAVNGFMFQDFDQSNDCGAVLDAGASCTVLVSFTPTATGARDALLVINDEDHIVFLYGNGTAVPSGTPDAGTPDGGTGSTCSHPLCTTGGPLTPTCDPCVGEVCGADPFCCNTAWDGICVGEVQSICDESCTPASSADAGTPDAGVPDAGVAGSCAHPQCTTGAPLTPSCSSCANAVCSQDPYCCTMAWDSICVSEVPTACGTTCP